MKFPSRLKTIFAINTPRGLLLILLLLILLPTFLYSLYQLTTFSSAEELLAQTYRRQLDGMLSSVNQSAWDVVSEWAAAVNRRLAGGEEERDSVLVDVLLRHGEVDGAFLADGGGEFRVLTLRRDDDRFRERLRTIAHGFAPELDRLARLRQAHYTKLEPVFVDSAGGDKRVVLLFATPPLEGRNYLAGFVIDPVLFIRDVLDQKLREVAGSEFTAAVVQKGTENVVISTDPVSVGEIAQRRTLWIFPDYEAGIRFRGTSAEELAAGRSRRSLGIVMFLDIVLAAGAWMAYSNIRREMELARLKSDFVSNVSHELRTPLALIRMYAETLEMGRVADDARRQEYYATIVSESGRLTRLVNNILNFSRMEAGRMPYSFAPSDVNGIVRTVLDVWSTHFDEEHVEVRTCLLDGMPSVELDTEATTEALMNLVDNAVKYGGDKKFVGITTAVDGANVVVSVEDHGIGIAPSYQQRIFEMFFRVSGGLTQSVRGSGVGLAIVRHIMKSHRGDVTVRSEAGKGSTFSLRFPLKQSGDREVKES